MTNPNPVIHQVAERLYRFSRIRERARVPIINSPRSAAAAAASNPGGDFDTLSDKQKAGWYAEALRITAPMVEAAAQAYSRGGTVLDPELLDPETEEIAGTIIEVFRKWRTAWRTATDDDLDFPVHAVSSALSALAALRAAFGWTPTWTAPEVVDDMVDYEKQTPAGDAVRLHLAAAHGHLPTLGAGDGEAEDVHLLLHEQGQGLYSHHPKNREWSDAEVQDAIAHAQIHHGQPRTQFDRPYQEHVERSPHTTEFDDLRLHLISAHCVVNAAELHDHEVIDAHDHEHTGPGTIRNHPPESTAWNVDKIHQVLNDVRDDSDLHLRYLDATQNVGIRLEENKLAKGNPA